MARYVRANRAQSTLTAGIDGSVTTATVASIGSFPATIAGDQFDVLLDAGEVTEELCLCTSVAGTVMTLTRGTPAFTHATGSTVTFVETKDSLENIASYLTQANASWLANPFDHGFKAWNFDPATASAGAAPTVGIEQLSAIKVRDDADISVSNVHVWVTTINVGGSGSFLGIINSAGTVVATSADQTTWGGSLGAKTVAMVGAPFTLVAGGFYWLALVIGTAGGTPAQFVRRAYAAGGVGNIGLTGVNARAASFSTGLSAITGFTPAAGVPAQAVSTEFWMAVS